MCRGGVFTTKTQRARRRRKGHCGKGRVPASSAANVPRVRVLWVWRPSLSQQGLTRRGSRPPRRGQGQVEAGQVVPGAGVGQGGDGAREGGLGLGGLAQE